MDPFLIVAGALTGFVVGVTGVGGGVLMTPVLLMVFGIAPQVAVGTDLWYAAITKLAAAHVHHQRGLVDWPIVFRLWTGSLSASLATVWWMRTQVIEEAQLGWMRAAIAAAVCVTAVGMGFSRPLAQLGRRFGAGPFRAWQAPVTIAVGAALGGLVTLTSVGAGALGAVALLYLYPSRLTPARLVATDIVHAIPLAMVAGVGHWSMSTIDWSLLRSLLVGSLPAAMVGARLSPAIEHGRLRVLLAVVLFLAGLKLAADVLR